MAEVASALALSPHITAILDAIRGEGEALATEPITMFIIEDAPESALFFLAQMYGVTGWGGWRVADSVEERRALILNAIQLQRTKGTPAAIKQAIATLGYGDVDIFKGVGIDYDGTYDYDGSIIHAGGNWASFRVRVNVGNDVEISAATAEIITNIIEEYKNARSVLVDLTWGLRFVDGLGGFDVFDSGAPSFSETVTGRNRYDGLVLADGSTAYAAPADSLDIRILPA